MGSVRLIAEMAASGVSGSVVTLICDGGDRYTDTYYDDDWLNAHDLDPGRYDEALRAFERDCSWPIASTVD